MITLYFEKVKEGHLKNTTHSDTYYDESIYLKEKPDGTIKSLTPRQVADLLGHSTSDITEMYYVKRNDEMLKGITDGFEI